jgi:hypothetical protein
MGIFPELPVQSYFQNHMSNPLFIAIVVSSCIGSFLLYYYYYYKTEKESNNQKRVRFSTSVYIKSYFDSIFIWFSHIYQNIKTQFHKIILWSYLSEGGIKTRIVPPNGSMNQFLRSSTNVSGNLQI